MRSLALLVLAAASPVSVQEGGELPRLRVGERLQGRLAEEDHDASGGPSRAFTLVAEGGGRVTVELASYDFDAQLTVEEAGGGRSEDDDGGVETNARITLEVAAGGAVVVRVAASDGAVGEFTLSASAGDPPSLDPGRELDLRLEFRRRAADRALEREDFAAAVQHLRARGLHQLEGSRLAGARETFTELLELAEPLGRRALAGEAGHLLSQVSIRLGELDRAQVESREALASFEAAGDARQQITVLGGLASALHQRGRFEEALAAVQRQVELVPRTEDRGLEAQVVLNLGAVYDGMGRFEDARATLERGEALCRELGRPRLLATALTNLGMAYQGLGRLDWAARALGEAVDLQRELGDVRVLPTALVNLGRVHHARGDLERARELCAEGLELSRRHANPYAENWALGWLALTFLDLADYPRALDLYRQRLELTRRLGDIPSESWTLWGLGSVHFAMGLLDEAGEELEEARELAARLGDERLRLDVLVRLGAVAYDRGDYAAAEESYTAALELARRLGDARLEGDALVGIGIVHTARGALDEAEAALREALAIHRASGTSGVNALLNLSRVLRRRGELLDALEMQREALRCAEEEGFPVRIVEAHLALGNTLHDLGDYERSRRHHDEVLTRARASGDFDAQSRALASIADLRMHMDDHRSGLTLLEEHLELAREHGWRSMEAAALAGIGRAHLELGEADQAAEVLEHARTLYAELGAPEPSVLTNLALARQVLGELDTAAELLRERLGLARRTGSSLGEAWALSHQAGLAQRRGDPEAAIARAVEAIAAFERSGSEHLATWPLQELAWGALQGGDLARAREALARAEELIERTAGDVLDIQDAAGLRARYFGIGLLEQDLCAARAARGEDDRAVRARLAEGFRDAGRWKSRALLAGIVEHRAGGRTLEATRLRRERREALAERDAALDRIALEIARGTGIAAIDALRARAGEREARAGELERELARTSPRDAALDAAPDVDPTELARRVLDEHSALLEYAEGGERAYLYVLTPRGLSHLDLGPKETLARQVEAFAGLIADPARLGGVSAVAERGGALYELLLAPAMAQIGPECERLIVVPTARLAGLPFEALVASDASRRAAATRFDQLEFVLDRFEVSYGPSSPVLLELADLGPRATRGRVLVLADPRYASEPAPTEGAGPPSPFGALALRASPAPRELARLPKTRDEALAIVSFLLELTPDDDAAAAAVQRLRTRRSGSASTELFDLHLGERASVDRLLGDLRGYFVLHVAAHGFVDRERPRHTGIALAYSERDDGFFTIADVLELDLDLDLTVLSACDTASGEVQTGGGVQSLARAFLYAGSRSVVASLWQVSDWAAAETMQSFYRAAIARGLHPAAALREAKLSLCRSGAVRGVAVGEPASSATAPAAHPFFWAPFIHVGLPR